MASVLKATSDIAKSAKKAKGKGKARADDGEGVVVNGNGNEVEKRRKDKVLLISSRGVTQRMRHLMHDLEALLPHTKKGGSGYGTTGSVN
jgi:ribosome biogenesis protein BRX1